jgi:hypothetical protein
MLDMKKLIFTSLLAVGIAAGSQAQGTVTFDNADNFSATPTAKTGGLIFAGGINVVSNPPLLTQDINLQLLGGPSPTSMTTIATLLLSNGSAVGDYSFLGNPGQFLDPTGNLYHVPGVPAGGIGYFDVLAWTGVNANSFAAAINVGEAFGQSGVFQSATGGQIVGTNPPTNPVSIGDAMPSFYLPEPGPEPGTLALFGLGAVTLLLFRCRK